MSTASRTIAGTVLDARGKPVAGARVYILRAPGPVPDVALLTGSDGTFTLSVNAEGAYEIGCSDDAHGDGHAIVRVDGHEAQVLIMLR